MKRGRRRSGPVGRTTAGRGGQGRAGGRPDQADGDVRRALTRRAARWSGGARRAADSAGFDPASGRFGGQTPDGEVRWAGTGGRRGPADSRRTATLGHDRPDPRSPATSPTTVDWQHGASPYGHPRRRGTNAQALGDSKLRGSGLRDSEAPDSGTRGSRAQALRRLRRSGTARGRTTTALTLARRGTEAGGAEPRGEELGRGHVPETASAPTPGQPRQTPLAATPGSPPAPPTTCSFTDPATPATTGNRGRISHRRNVAATPPRRTGTTGRGKGRPAQRADPDP